MNEPATTGYQFTVRRTCGHEETVTLYGNHERRNEQRRRARAEVCAECKPVISPTLARLIKEVRIEDPAHPLHPYNRTHTRHNRS